MKPVDAKRAFAILNGLIDTFPFETPNDRAVAFSMIVTACVRRSLPTAPLHAISAPTAGNGKGKLVDIACVIAQCDPVVEAMERRPALVVAALTILRAYHVAGKPEKPTPLGSFEAWSDLVRGALMWAGSADPVETMNRLRKSEPVLEALRAVMGQWREAFGILENATTAEAIREATATNPDPDGPPGKFVLDRPDFRDALMNVAGRGGQIGGHALGHWLLASAGRIVGIGEEEPRPKFYFERAGARCGVAVWGLRVVKDPDLEGEPAEKLHREVEF